MGDPDASWMGAIDPTYLRPGQDTEVDKELYELLKPYGVQPGDPLPPLDAAGLQLLKDADAENKKNGKETHYYEQYLDNLPELSQGQKDLAVLKVAGALDTLQRHSKELEEQLPGLEDALAAQKKFNEGKITQAQLEPHLKVIQQALSMDQEFANSRALVDSISGISYQQSLTENNGELGGKSGLVEPTPGESLQDARKRFFEEGAKAFGLDPKTGKPVELTLQQRAQASAATAAGLNTVARTGALEQQIGDYNEQNDALTEAGGADPAQAARMDQWHDQIESDSDAIQTVQQNVKKLQEKLPGRNTMTREELRQDDIKAAKEGGDEKLAGRLTEWNDLQNDIESLTKQMDESGDPYQKKLAKDYYKPLAGLAELNYNTIARDQGSRDPKSLLDGMPLPSSGHPDLYFAARAAYYTPAQDKAAAGDELVAKALDRGGLLHVPGATKEDRRTQLAAQGITDRQSMFNQYLEAAGIDPSKPLSKKQIEDLGGKKVVDAITDYEKDHDGDGKIWVDGTLVERDGEIFAVWRFRETFHNPPPPGTVAQAKGGYTPGPPETETKIWDQEGMRYDDLQDFLDNNKIFNENTKISTAKDWT
ncbi:MAG: hypothetical protein ACRDQ0_15290, partial [Pseudonocardia sp.]